MARSRSSSRLTLGGVGYLARRPVGERSHLGMVLGGTDLVMLPPYGHLVRAAQASRRRGR